jgi:hypothetical protein
MVSARRLSLLGPRPASRFIPRDEIRDVYREGSAIQIHLRGAGEPFFRFWAEDPGAAARIVAQLPTERTIEFESSLQEPETRSSWKSASVWILVVVLAAGAAGVYLNRARAPIAATIRSEAPPVSGMPSAIEPPASAADDLLTEAKLRRYSRRIVTLSGEFGSAFDSLRLGALSQERFIEGIDGWLLPQWEALALQLSRESASAPALGAGATQAAADAEISAVIANWQLALKSYRDDLRAGRTVVSAFDYLQRADAHQTRVEAQLESLERRTRPTGSAR